MPDDNSQLPQSKDMPSNSSNTDGVAAPFADATNNYNEASNPYLVANQNATQNNPASLNTTNPGDPIPYHDPSVSPRFDNTQTPQSNPIQSDSLSQTQGTSPTNPYGTPQNASQEVTMPYKPRKGPPKALLALLVLVFILISFGGALLYFTNKKDDVGEPTDTEGEIVWWGFEDESVYADSIKKFEEKNANTKVTYEKQSPVEYRERLTNALAKGDGPDVFTYHNSWVPMFKNDLDVIPSFIMSPEDFSNKFYPVISADLVRSNGVVGIPLEYDAITLFVNEEIFSTAAKTPPNNWDDLRVLAKDLTQRDPRGQIIQAGAALGITKNIDHWPEIIGFMLYQNHATPSVPTNREASEAMRFYKQFEEDKVWNATLPPSVIAFADGKVAMLLGTAEDVGIILKRNPNLQFRTIELPQLRRDDRDEPDVSYATYWVQGVWLKSQSRGVAWRFLDYMSSQEALTQIHSNEEKLKKVGSPYPRIDMSSRLEGDRYVGSIIKLAPYAKSWYMAGGTNDGVKGINTQISTIYEELFENSIPGDLSTFGRKIATVLAQYGLGVK